MFRHSALPCVNLQQGDAFLMPLILWPSAFLSSLGLSPNPGVSVSCLFVLKPYQTQGRKKIPTFFLVGCWYVSWFFGFFFLSV